MKVEELSETDRAKAVQLWMATGLTRPWNDPAADFDRALEGRTSTVLGVRDEDELVATAMVGHDGHRGWVYYVAVEPGRQRQGIGAALMHAAEEWLRSDGAVKIQLMVRHSNEGAADFYEALGYHDAEVRVLAHWLVKPPE
jgi:ribosomal protein S18 acetylase RimI-like enzyme